MFSKYWASRRSSSDIGSGRGQQSVSSLEMTMTLSLTAVEASVQVLSELITTGSV